MALVRLSDAAQVGNADTPPSPQWLEFQAAFESWCAHNRVFGRLRRGSSEAVYRAMWQALATWCGQQRPALRLPLLDAASLLRYLASRSGMAGQGESLTPRYQRRLLGLVHWVQRHQASSGSPSRPVSADAAASLIASQTALRRANAADDKDVPACLSPADCALLFAWLTCGGAGSASTTPTDAAACPDALAITAGASVGATSGTGSAPLRWQALRDRCAVGLQLGAGLGPGDLRALRLDDVLGAGGPPHAVPAPARPPAQLRVPASGSAPVHVVPMAPWAASLLAQWLAERRQQGLAGPWLFPSTRSGKPWGKVAQYNAARQVLAGAGLDPGAGGSFRLRHSFALRQLQAGQAPETVARWLGVVDPAVMARYQRLLDPTRRAAAAAVGAAVGATLGDDVGEVTCTASAPPALPV
jgi:hypothetical protein